MKLIYRLVLLACCIGSNNMYGQNANKTTENVKSNLANIKFAGNLQTWARYMSYNPGSTLYGYKKDKGADIGIRRIRLNMTGQPTDRVLFYMQLSLNNFNYLSDRKLGLFISDALTEYAIKPTYLSVGMGLSAWSGLSRFASPSTVSFLGIDAPLYQQSTNDVTDQFLRKLSIYAKGKINKLDYRIALAHPMVIQKSVYNTAITTNSSFSQRPPSMQLNSYIQYQCKEQESNVTPYTTGTYLGKKKIFNVGTGIVYQPKAMWHLENTDTVTNNILQVAADVFYDAPIAQNGQAISLYACYTYSDFGKNYYRNLAVMNPMNGNTSTNINGSGNGYPSVGTGQCVYAQAGYKFKDNLFHHYTLMPYISAHYNKLQRIADPVVYYDAGLNILLNGHQSKVTLAWQNRPIVNSTYTIDSRKSAWLVQYQTSF